jgi:hypothetical protein
MSKKLGKMLCVVLAIRRNVPGHVKSCLVVAG